MQCVNCWNCWKVHIGFVVSRLRVFCTDIWRRHVQLRLIGQIDADILGKRVILLGNVARIPNVRKEILGLSSERAKCSVKMKLMQINLNHCSCRLPTNRTRHVQWTLDPQWSPGNPPWPEEQGNHLKTCSSKNEKSVKFVCGSNW